mmetsp:Transcript_314/g.585  ORF Transcript_314/g.585 Transcript_314/m.585 type:complete len:205 (+) Transcript_314:72-686(+)
MTSLLDLLRLSQRRLPVDLGYCECEGRRVPRQGRRAGLLSAAAALLLGNVPAPARAVSPYKLASELDLGLLKGRIRTCPGNVNPNCVSTSSLSDAYQSPWKTPEQTDMNEACQLIKEVVLGLSPDASLEAFSAVSEEDPERGKYLQFQVPGRFGLDKVSEVETNQTPPLPLPSFLLHLLLLLPLCCCCYRTGMLTVCIRRWSSW